MTCASCWGPTQITSTLTSASDYAQLMIDRQLWLRGHVAQGQTLCLCWGCFQMESSFISKRASAHPLGAALLHPGPLIFFVFSIPQALQALSCTRALAYAFLSAWRTFIWCFMWLPPHHSSSSSPQRDRLRPTSLSLYPMTLSVHLIALSPIWNEHDYFFLCQLPTP